MVATLTIGGVPYTLIEDQYDQTNTLDERQRLKADVIDYTGTAHWEKGEQVIVTDPVLGVMFRGYLNADQEFPIYPTGAIRHTIDAIDQHYLADKRTYTREYDTPTYSGKIAVDQLHDVLSTEGLATNYALHEDDTTADFNTGILSSIVGTANVGDGDLELAPAGSNVTITESTTADFASGTLSNVTAANNTLAPNTQMALKFTVDLPISTDPKVVNSFIYVKFWTGSMTIGVNDTLNFDVWISDQSPQKIGGIVPLFSNLTVPGGIYDQNGLLNDNAADLSAYAVNQWYTRNESLSAYNGKTIIAMMAQVGGNSVGQYTWYIRNAYLGSQTGNKFFSPTQTAPQLHPITVYQYAYYVATTFQTSVVTTFNPVNSYRVSTSHSIDAVRLLKSSFITWQASSSVLMYVSYNAGSSWIPCSNNAPLPGLPAGSNVAGLSMQLQEVFGAGNDPTGIPALDSVSVSLLSAPNATKSDIVTSFLTQTNWNTGTYSGTQADVSGNLELAPYVRNWNDNLITNQTAFFPSGTTQAASGGVYTQTCGPVNSPPATMGFGTSRLDFAGTMLDFTLDIDIKCSANCETGVTYRQIQWNSSVNNTFGYLFSAYQGAYIEFGYGSNGTTDNFTQLATANVTITAGTTYHVKLIVNGDRHLVYWNNATTPTLDIIDSTYTQAGGIGLRIINHDASANRTATWDNFTLAQTPSGTWTGPSTSVSSLGSCGGSVITWIEKNTSNATFAFAFIQSSIDGGSTYQQCVSGQPILGLTSGVSLAGKSVIVQILLGTQNNTMPEVQGLVWRVLGAYPGSSGTRSTVPLGNDTMVRSNVVGAWGTGFDSQTYAKVGTGTVNLNSNEGQIANTTGDVHMVYGSRTWTDEDGTCRFSLSASTITGGIELRYADSNNFYRLAATTTALSIIKKSTGTTTTLATTTISLTTNVFYRLRFRIVGNGPVNFFGRVWADGVKEDQTTWTLTATN